MIFSDKSIKSIPAPYRSQKYYHPEEVRKHNTANDCWVSIFNDVYDLTQIIQIFYSKLTDPIVKAAGQDISHWFDPITKNVFAFIQPKVCVVEGSCYKGYYAPNGQYLHLPPNYPDSSWKPDYKIP